MPRPSPAVSPRSGHRVVALCDPNPARMAFHNRLLTVEGEPAATTWELGRFADLLAEEDIEESSSPPWTPPTTVTSSRR
ncbi:hypothetical protein [Streptomyces sp. NPDC094149]|uniref:hypothetical protein n=1 Tax=Streptomyces sp. NPDC094149 TaxID=3155079 RepID=UPI003334A49C